MPRLRSTAGQVAAKYRVSYGGDTVITDDPGMPKALRGLVARLGALVERYGR